MVVSTITNNTFHITLTQMVKILSCLFDLLKEKPSFLPPHVFIGRLTHADLLRGSPEEHCG